MSLSDHYVLEDLWPYAHTYITSLCGAQTFYLCVSKLLFHSLQTREMKSFTVLAFGLVVLVAVSMAYPQEAEEDDDVADELALQEGEGMFKLMLFSTFNVTLEEFPQK